MLLAARLGHGSVVELLDDLVADISRLKAGEGQYCTGADGMFENSPSKANTPTSARRVAEDSARTHLVRREDGGEFLNPVIDVKR